MNMAEYGSQRLKPQNVNCESIIRGLKKISFKNPFHIYKIQLQKKNKGGCKMENVMKNFHFFLISLLITTAYMEACDWLMWLASSYWKTFNQLNYWTCLHGPPSCQLSYLKYLSGWVIY